MIEYIKYLRIIATFFVIGQHLPIEKDNKILFDLVDSVLVVAVPVFFVISGGLNISKAKLNSVRSFLFKKSRRIIIPLLFWTIFYLIIGLVFGHIRYDEIIRKVLSGRPSVHLWFLYNLLVLYLITPFLAKLISGISTKRLLLIFLIFQLLVSCYVVSNIRIQYFFIEAFIYLNYYLLGYLIIDRRIHKNINFYIFVLTFIFSILLIFLFQEYRLFSISRLSIPSLLITFSLFGIFQNFNYKINIIDINILDRLSFGIYLIHIVFIILINKINLLNLIAYQALSLLFNMVLVFLISFFVCYIISKVPFMKRTIGLF